MGSGNRDMGINHIRARADRRCYGMGLGIIILDDIYPGFPGDVRNASTYPYNVQYEIVEGVDIDALVFKNDKSPCRAPIIEAAQKLEQKGCRAISAECGYFAYFQKDVTAKVRVPVFISALLQVPMAQQVIGPDQVVGIFAGTGPDLWDEHLAAVGIEIGSNYVIAGAMDGNHCIQMRNLWHEEVRPQVPEAYYDEAEKDFVARGVEFFEKHPNMGAMVLECTGFPPFARALQRRIEIPVFSYSTLHDFAYSVAVHRDFYGHV